MFIGRDLDAQGGSNAPELRLKVPCIGSTGFAKIILRGRAMFGELGIPEVLFILGIALLIFGPKKLGDLGKGLGEGIRGFKSALRDDPKSGETKA